MTTANVATVSGNANRSVDGIIRTSGRVGPLARAIARLSRQMWPVKTDAELALRTGLSDRACRRIIAERASISGEQLAALLRTEDGIVFLEALMGDATPKWWQRFKRSARLGVLREAIERQRVEIERLELAAGQIDE